MIYFGKEKKTSLVNYSKNEFFEESAFRYDKRNKMSIKHENKWFFVRKLIKRDFNTRFCQKTLKTLDLELKNLHLDFKKQELLFSTENKADPM